MFEVDGMTILIKGGKVGSTAGEKMRRLWSSRSFSDKGRLTRGPWGRLNGKLEMCTRCFWQILELIDTCACQTRMPGVRINLMEDPMTWVSDILIL